MKLCNQEVGKAFIIRGCVVLTVAACIALLSLHVADGRQCIIYGVVRQYIEPVTIRYDVRNFSKLQELPACYRKFVARAYIKSRVASTLSYRRAA